MHKPLTRPERKAAARMMIKMARTHGCWTDGQRIYRGAEMDALLRKASNALVNDVGERRSPPHRLANAMSILRMIRDRPSVHKMPERVPEMLAVRARSLLRQVLAGTPGSMEHFILTRRLAKRAGSVGRCELLLPQERFEIARSIDQACRVVTLSDIVTDDGVTCPAGVTLVRDLDSALVTPDGDVVVLDGADLIGLVRPVGKASREPRPDHSHLETSL